MRKYEFVILSRQRNAMAIYFRRTRIEINSVLLFKKKGNCEESWSLTSWKGAYHLKGRDRKGESECDRKNTALAACTIHSIYVHTRNVGQMSVLHAPFTTIVLSRAYDECAYNFPGKEFRTHHHQGIFTGVTASKGSDRKFNTPFLSHIEKTSMCRHR